MNLKISVFLAASIVIGGCAQRGGTVTNGVVSPYLPVDISVAKKALGMDAISVDPFTGNDITIPGIYRVIRDSSGNISFKQICENDTTQQSAINSMRSKEVSNSEILEDSLSPVRIKVTVPGMSLSQPYKKIKVSGYKIKRVYSGDSGYPEDWIINNVEIKCKSETLKENKPYVVVTSVATADNVETVTGGGLSETSFALGVIGVQIDPITPVAEARRANRIFAIQGKFVDK